LTRKPSSITNITLNKTRLTEDQKDDILPLDLNFKIDGSIREAFNPKMWEIAYNKHDNLFRMSISVTFKEGRRKISQTKFIRKAPLFWTRSPKIPFRIWVSIIKDDTPFYPQTVEEAQSLLFDVNKIIEIKPNDLKRGNHNLYADIQVSWGKHYYSEQEVITNKSDTIDVYF
jgi:hypothetical protein